MKKTIAMLLSVILLFSLTACNQDKEKTVLAAGADITTWVEAIEKEEIQAYLSGVYLEYDGHGAYGFQGNGDQTIQVINALTGITYQKTDKQSVDLDKSAPLFGLGLFGLDWETGKSSERAEVCIWFAQDCRYAYAALRSDMDAVVYEVNDPQKVLDFFMDYDDQNGYQDRLKQYGIK